MNVTALLGDRAVAHPDRIALIDRVAGQWRTTTYAQLEQASQRLALTSSSKAGARGTVC
ncbi:MAG: hypothetical protein HC838_13810 [Spirulinaceae cyanobacterium RM2_2_10]|nr:hypothetical protein [Spirulinaceae cyanobacterium RM2_2_10]